MITCKHDNILTHVHVYGLHVFLYHMGVCVHDMGIHVYNMELNITNISYLFVVVFLVFGFLSIVVLLLHPWLVIHTCAHYMQLE